MPSRHSRLLPWLLAYKALRTPVAFGVCGIVDDESGHILLVRQRYAPGWHFPGGGVERGEPPAQAVIRELQEEVGLKSHSPPILFGLYTRVVGATTNVVALYRVPDARASPSSRMRKSQKFYGPICMRRRRTPRPQPCGALPSCAATRRLALTGELASVAHAALVRCQRRSDL